MIRIKNNLMYLLIPSVAVLLNIMSLLEDRFVNDSFYMNILLSMLCIIGSYGIVGCVGIGMEKEQVQYSCKDFVYSYLIANLVVIICYYFQNAMFNLLYACMGYIPQQYMSLSGDVIFEDMYYSFFEKLALIVCFGFVTPIFEELFFRRIMQSGYNKVALWIRMLLVNICFIMSHDDIDLMIFILPMSIICSWITYQEKSVWYASVIHCFVNVVGVLELRGSGLFFSVKYAIKYREKGTAIINSLFSFTLVTLFVSIVLLLENHHRKDKIEEVSMTSKKDNVLYIIASLIYIYMMI